MKPYITALENATLENCPKLHAISRSFASLSNRMIEREPDSLTGSLIPFIGTLVLHVIVVWVFCRFKHRNCGMSLWCGLLSPKPPRGAFGQLFMKETSLDQKGDYPCQYFRRVPNLCSELVAEERVE